MRIPLPILVLAVTLVLSGCGARDETTKEKTIDLRTLLEAHFGGTIEQYVGHAVSGTGQNVYPFENGRGETIWIASLAVSSDGNLESLSSFNQWVHAQMQMKRVLYVVLRCKDSDRIPKFQDWVRFSGVFRGEHAIVESLISVDGGKSPPERAPVLVDCSVSFVEAPTGQGPAARRGEPD